MSQPPSPFERSFSFTDFSVNTPNLQQPGNKVDQELNNVRTSLNATIARLGEIQRDDGLIRDTAFDTTFLTNATNSAVNTVNSAGASIIASANASKDAAAVSATQSAASATQANSYKVQAQSARNDTYTSAAEIAATKTYVTNIANGMNASNTAALASIASSVNTVNGYVQTVSDYASAAQISVIDATTQATAAEAYANQAGDYVGEALTYANQAQASAEAAALSAASAPAVPTGGGAGQVLSKIDGTDYNTQWVDQSGGGTENALPLAGGTMDAGAVIDFASTGGKDSEIGAWGFGVEDSGNHLATVEPMQIRVWDGDFTTGTAITSQGISFNDGSQQTTAATSFTYSNLTHTFNNGDTEDPQPTFSYNLGFGGSSSLLLKDESTNDRYSVLNQSGLTIYKSADFDSADAMVIGNTGITFPDGTTQTTAATGSASLDGVAIEHDRIESTYTNESPNDTNWYLTAFKVGGRDIEGSWSLGVDGLHFPDGTTQTTAVDIPAYLQDQSNPDYTSVLNGNASTFGVDAYFKTLAVDETVSGFRRGISADNTGLYILPNAKIGFMSSFDPVDITYQTTAFTGWNNSALTGTPTAPTAATSTNTTQIATTAFVKNQGYLTSSSAASTYFPKPIGTTSQYLRGDGTLATYSTGDKYVTTSTTSLTISNGSKTLTIGTGLSYSSQQDVTIAFDSNNHMHGTVTSYNSSTGSMVVDVYNKTGSGTYTSWVVNVGGIQGGSYLQIANNLSDLNNAATARTSLGLSSLATASFATDAQVIAGTSSTTVIAPSSAKSLRYTNNGSEIDLTPYSWLSSFTVWTGTRNRLNFPISGTTAIGQGQWAIENQFASLGNGFASGMDWSKRVTLFGRFALTQTSASSNNIFRYTLGKGGSGVFGDLGNAGIGVRCLYGSALEIQCHNGTTLTNFTTTYTPTFTGANFDIRVDSDGAGNVTCFINGTQVGTTTGGPTSTTGSTRYWTNFELVSTTTNTNAPSANGSAFKVNYGY